MLSIKATRSNEHERIHDQARGVSLGDVDNAGINPRRHPRQIRRPSRRAEVRELQTECPARRAQARTVRVDEHKYWAFISYSHRDTRWADWLHRAIESYRPPRRLVGTSTPHGAVPKRLTPVFRDREELASATDLGSVINAALGASACQVVICSPQAAKSHWVNQEILAFKRLGREDRIFCLIVGGEPNPSDLPGREDEECFPPALRFRLGPDGELGTTRTEPIAADARPGKDG